MAAIGLTPTDMLAAASEVLLGSGYRQVPDDVRVDWRTQHARLFEDAYGIVAVVVYETWDDLRPSWPEAQSGLVEVTSRFMTSSDPKAWEGYLVLLTPSVVTGEGRREADRIRYDTTRVRKLVATGDELKTLADVRRTLLPLLPLDEVRLKPEESTLEMLPDLLVERGVPRDAVQVLIRAFLDQLPLVEKLHQYRTQQ